MSQDEQEKKNKRTPIKRWGCVFCYACYGTPIPHWPADVHKACCAKESSSEGSVDRSNGGKENIGQGRMIFVSLVSWMCVGLGALVIEIVACAQRMRICRWNARVTAV